MSLFTAHPLALETAYSELKRQASEQTLLLAGTPGSVGPREVAGRSFLYRQFYDAAGKKRADYLGRADDPAVQERADLVREAITITLGLLEQARFLARQGYVRADTPSTAVVTAAARRGLFQHGAVLIGSHAYGVVLNELGVKAPAFRTADVDLARGPALSTSVAFAEVLAESLIPLTPVLGFDRKAPPTTWKAPGREGLRVGLVVPAVGKDVGVRAVPELSTHATALPHLDYLLVDPIDAVLLGREAVVPVRVPQAARFAWHKMLVSQLRTSTSDKRNKDLHQAAVLFAILTVREPDALAEARHSVPDQRRMRAASSRVRELLEEGGHERAVELLGDLV